MNWLEAFFLGIIQGATEFLPISSSGHLLLIPTVFNLEEPDLNGIAIAHLGTLLAVLVYFRRDLWQIAVAMIEGLRKGRPMVSANARLGWFIALGTLPVIVLGTFLTGVIEDVLSNPTTAAILLIFTGIILFIGERSYTGSKPLRQMSWTDSLTVGVVQVLALLPGISRSGVTISAGMVRELQRPDAARFSFLLGVPAIAGAGLLAILDLTKAPDLSNQIGGLMVTFLTSAFVGYACIHWLLRWLRYRKLYIFVIYCIAFGLLYLLINWL